MSYTLWLGVSDGMLFVNTFCYNKLTPILVKLYATNTTLIKLGVCEGMLSAKLFFYNKSSITVRRCAANTTFSLFVVSDGMLFVRPLLLQHIISNGGQTLYSS